MNKKTNKLLSLLMAFTMMIGIFTGIALPAKAAEPSYTLELTEVNIADSTNIDINQIASQLLPYSAVVDRLGNNFDYIHNTWLKGLCQSLDKSDNPAVFGYTRENAQDQVKVSYCYYNGSNYMLGVNMTTLNSLRNCQKFYIVELKENSSDPQTKEETKDSSDEGSAHQHSFSWVTVQEAGAGQDGIEEYRCSCGDVAERSMIPASQVFVKGLYGEIKNAPQNGLVQFDSGRLYTMSDYIIRKLAERSDITTVVTFEYERKAYKMTIPAGLDYTTILADTDCFYGYFYFAKLVGATIEAV